MIRQGFGSLEFMYEEDFVECGKIPLIDMRITFTSYMLIKNVKLVRYPLILIRANEVI